MTSVSASDFKTAYPEFADSDDDAIARYLGEADIWVGSNWGDDETRGVMLYAAHCLEDGGQSAILARTTSIGSGSHRTTLKTTDGIGFDTTRYGSLFLSLKRRYTVGNIYAV